MAVNVRSGLEIPEPSDHSSGEEDDLTCLIDLPQPAKLTESEKIVDKLLNNLVDDAWEIISEQEKIKRDMQAARQIPVLNATKEMQLPAGTNCMGCSDDGLYLFLGHACGLSVISTSTLTCVRTWQDERIEFTSMSCASLGKVTHVLCTVDDMGIARLFVHHMENIYLIKTINETEDINKRNICKKLDVSRSGDFGAAVMMASGSVWLDVYRFPQDVWVKELEAKQATEVKLSPVVLLMKIRPPEIPGGTSLKSVFEVLQKTEEGTIIGSGQNHLISSHQWENQDMEFEKMYLSSSSVGTPRHKAEDPSNCTCHFLLQKGFYSMPEEDRDIPVALCLWWNGTHNLLQYLLVKSPKEKDAEPRPDVLWPNSQEILCSSVSDCTRFIVLGLEGHLVTVWDRLFGWPYANIVIPGNGAISKMKILLESQYLHGPFLPAIQLVLTCKSGECYSVTASRGEDSSTVALIERPKDPSGSATLAEPLPFLKCLVLLMQRNGQVSVWKMDDGALVFALNLPHTHVLSSLREPVCVLEPVQQKLYITAKRRTSLAKVTNSEEDEGSLFIFSFSDCSLMDRYRVSRPALTEQKTTTTFSDLEETCNLYIQHRAESWKESGSGNVPFHWEKDASK